MIDAMNSDCVLSVNEMYMADAAACELGIASIDLMEAAGSAVAREIKERWTRQPVTILCGPGNNGGDGFVVARLLERDGWPVSLLLLGNADALGGDAAINAKRWKGKIHNQNSWIMEDVGLVVDAMFGAGLSRPLEGQAGKLADLINEKVLGGKMSCVAVDMPSGIDGDSGQIIGSAVRANLTVTFFRAKPGHLLLPGSELSGEVVVRDIGIPASVLDGISPATFVNSPRLWSCRYPWPEPATNKYGRGHAVVLGGPKMTGAARLASLAARRVGAGLVSIAAPPQTFSIYAGGMPGTLFSAVDDDPAFDKILSDKRKNTVLLGPGAGISDVTRRRVVASLKAQKSVVLDADALTVFRDDPGELFDLIAALTDCRCLLTPHEGEFPRLFPGGGDKLIRVRTAARISGAVVLLKGYDTVIAAPDGRAIINKSSSCWLSTAGTGDVLAGLAAGLIAQGMGAFDAAAAAAWLHSACGDAFGPGLIAEDISEMLPKVLCELKDRSIKP